MKEILTSRMGLSAGALALVLTGTMSSSAQAADIEIYDGGPGNIKVCFTPEDQSCSILNAFKDRDTREDYYGDDDRDTVPNIADKFPSFDDTKIDFDGDGLPNYLDNYVGQNSGDMDGDGLVNSLDSFYGDDLGDEDYDGQVNFLDPRPYTPASSSATSTYIPRPSTPMLPLPERNPIAENFLNDFKQERLIEIYDLELDADNDLLPDDEDTTPSPLTNDWDDDGEADFFDPKPSDPYINSRNDPLNIRNNIRLDQDGDGYKDYADTEYRNPYVTPKNDLNNIQSDAYQDKIAEQDRLQRQQERQRLEDQRERDRQERQRQQDSYSYYDQD